MAFLDADLPPWKVSELQPIDEFFYTIPAFNLYHYGEMSHRVFPFIPTDGAPLNLLQNVITAPALIALGNTYYGLRVASVVAGLVSLVLIYFVLSRQTPVEVDDRSAWFRNVIPLMWAAYFVADFAFSAATRVAEPTIFQLLALVAVMFMASAWRFRERSHTWRAAAFSFAAVSACLFVYPLNFFIVPAVGLTLLVEAGRHNLRTLIVDAVAALAGGVLSILLYAAIVFVTYGETLTDLYRNTVQPLSGRVGSGVGPAPWLEMLSTNIFRFDFPLLAVALIAVPVFLYRTVNERDTFGLLVVLLLACLIVQTKLAPDYQYRKLLLMGPLVVVMLSMALPYAPAFIRLLGSNRIALIATLAWLVFAEALGLAVYGYFRDSLDPSFKRFSQIAVAALVATLIAGYLLRGRRGRLLTGVGMAAVIAPTLYLSWADIYRHPTFHYRDAMVAAGPTINGKVTVGEWSLAFRLYNTSIPLLNPYQYWYKRGGTDEYQRYMERLFGSGDADYSIATQGSFPARDVFDATEVQAYELDVEETPVIAIYRVSVR